MLKAIQALLASRKAIVTASVLIAASLAVFFGKMTVEQASSLAKFLVPALVVAIAAEDAGKAIALGPTSPANTTSVEVSVPQQTQVTETSAPAPASPQAVVSPLPLPTGPFGPEKPL